MPEVLLPGGQADQINRQRQQQAALVNIRLDIAKHVFSNLVQTQYQLAAMAAKEQEGMYGGSHDPDEPKRMRLDLDIGTPARVAVEAAENLMVALGLIELTKPPINNGPR